jgi:hypothetical protein
MDWCRVLGSLHPLPVGEAFKHQHLALNGDIAGRGETMEELVEFAVMFLLLLQLFALHIFSGQFDLLALQFLRLLVAIQVQLVGAGEVIRDTSIGFATFIQLDAGLQLHHLVRLGVQGLHHLSMVVLG